jgi:hypothetical protein
LFVSAKVGIPNEWGGRMIRRDCRQVEWSSNVILRVCLACAIALASFVVLARPAWAGPNTGGMLLLHANPSLTASTGNCGLSDLRSCDAAVIEVPANGVPTVCYVLAVFPDYASPRVCVVTFGIQYDNPDVGPVAWGVCGNGYLTTTAPGWPTSGSGVAVQWDEAQRQNILEICWFVSEPNSIGTIKAAPHPTQPVAFTDDGIPAQSDEAEAYGMLGFGTRGSNPCGHGPLSGACCGADGSCALQSRSACADLTGHAYLGDYSSCAPNPCTSETGACCVRGTCRLIPPAECLEVSGSFLGTGVDCRPVTCSLPFRVGAPTPNPSRGRSTLAVDLSGESGTRLEVLDVAGRLICTLLDGPQNQGPHLVTWDGQDDAGRQVESGVYFYRFRSPNGNVIRRTVIAR